MVAKPCPDNDIAAWSVHGGRLKAAEQAFPTAPRPWIDLSTGISPFAYDRAAEAIDWRALPDEGALRDLEAAAASFFGMAADNVCAVPGTEIGLRLLGALDLPAPHRHVAPAYATHADIAPGAVSIAREALANEADSGGTVLLANPNNPDGLLTPRGQLAAVAARMAARGGTLIVDEAFADTDPDIGLWPCLEEDLRAHVIILRSFGKFFGLAGIRLGFVCAAPARLAALRRVLGAWPVSAAAIVIGGAAYRDADWIAGARSRIAADAARLDALLRGHGLDAEGASPLFRLVRTPDAQRLFTRLCEHGILTRPFAYAANWLRLGLPDGEEAWARLDRALADG